MSLTIDDPQLERLARELASRTGESVNEAIAGALKLRLQQEPPIMLDRRNREGMAERLMEIGRSAAPLFRLAPGEPPLSLSHGDLLYDEDGLPK